jgi:hypothetical protein
MTRELLKKEIDNLSDELLIKVYEFINQFKAIKKGKDRIINLETFDLGKDLDNIDIRKFAYEQNNN